MRYIYFKNPTFLNAVERFLKQYERYAQVYGTMHPSVSYLNARSYN